MPWRQDRSGTLLRHSFAHALRSLSVSRAMQLATFMLVLVYQARHSSSPRQEHRFRTHASLTLNARVKANWATLSPNRGCVGPTCASAPGVDTLLPQRDREQTIRPLQVSQHVCCLLRPSRSAWDANPGARDCQLSQNRYDSRPQPELPHPSNSWICMPWIEGFRLALNACSCMPSSRTP